MTTRSCVWQLSINADLLKLEEHYVKSFADFLNSLPEHRLIDYRYYVKEKNLLNIPVSYWSTLWRTPIHDFCILANKKRRIDEKESKGNVSINGFL